jgi:hypothetical protein
MDLVRIQDSFVRLLLNLTKIENSFLKSKTLVKRVAFQFVIRPPEAPTEGRYSSLLKKWDFFI